MRVVFPLLSSVLHLGGPATSGIRIDTLLRPEALLMLRKATVASRSIVAAGSIVARSVPRGSVVGGVPARVLKSVDKYLAGLRRKSLGCGTLPPAENEAFFRRHFLGQEKR